VNILAIDQSVSDSGVAIYKSEFPDRMDFTNIRPGKRRGPERLAWIRDQLVGLIKVNEIDVLIKEEYAYGARGAVFDMGEVGGLIKIVCVDTGVHLIEMPIGSHKKFTTGNGNAKKSLILKSVYKNYGIDLTNENTADAVSMLKTYLGFMDWKAGGTFPQVQTAALKKFNDSLGG